MTVTVIIDCFLKRRREGQSNPVSSRFRYKRDIPAPYEFHCASAAQLSIVTRIRETSKERTA